MKKPGWQGHYLCDGEGCEKEMIADSGRWATVSMLIKPQNDQRLGGRVTRHYCGECAAKRGIMLDDEGRFIMGKSLVIIAKEKIYSILESCESILKQPLKVNIGDVVSWRHKPEGQESFLVKGTILDIFETQRGGGRGKPKMVARIKVEPHPYYEKIKRETAVINLDKLIR